MKSFSVLEIREFLKALDAYDLLDKSFSVAEVEATLKKQFRVLAFQYHPDRNSHEQAHKKFVTVNESYQKLAQILNNNSSLLFASLPDKISQEQKIYRLYKTACRNYSAALEDYFQKVKVVNLAPDSPAYVELSSVLQAVKEQFAWVLKSEPLGLWANDSLEKIERINLWLKK